MEIVPATVTQVSPLRVRLDLADSDNSAVKITVFTATVGLRVAVVEQGTSVLVIGPYA